MSRTKRSPLLFMALTIFIDFAGFGLILPLLPFWAQRLGADQVAVGLTLAVYALAQVLCMPMVGRLSDRFGRKPVIIVSLLIEVASLALTVLAGSLSMPLIARFTGGLGASNIGTAQAVVSDVTTAQDRAKGMGWMGAAIGLGFVIGPAVGGVLAPLRVALPFWAAMVVALVNALLVMRFLPETQWVHLHLCGRDRCADAGWTCRTAREALGSATRVDCGPDHTSDRAHLSFLCFVLYSTIPTCSPQRWQTSLPR